MGDGGPGTFTMLLPPPEGYERFAPGALDCLAGEVICVRDESTQGFAHATVTACEVTEGGSACLVTVEVPGGGLPWPEVPEGRQYRLVSWHDIRF